MHKEIPDISKLQSKYCVVGLTRRRLQTLPLLNVLPAEQGLHIPLGIVQQTLCTLWLCYLGSHICTV